MSPLLQERRLHKMRFFRLVMCGFALCLALQFLVNVPAYAADLEYYVDDDTGDDADNGTTEALAWKTIQHALDTFTLASSAGDYTRINIKSTNTYVITTELNDTSLAAPDGDNFLIIQGYDSTVGDGGQATIDCDDGTPDADHGFAWTKEYVIFVDLIIQDSTDHAFTSTSADFLGFIRCNFLNAGDKAWNAAYSYPGHSFFLGCLFSGPTGDGMQTRDHNILLAYNVFKNCGSEGFRANTGENVFLFKNVIADTGDVSYKCNDAWGVLVENTFYDSTGPNVEFDYGNCDGMLAINNIFDTSTTYNIQVDSGSFLMCSLNNVLLNGTSGTYTGAASVILEDITSATTDYDDSSNTLDDSAFPSSAISNNTWNHEPGALDYEETGGVGGGTTGQAF